MNIYREMGLRPVINARGRRPTILGGSVLPDEVMDVMRRANESFMDMPELIDGTGQTIANALQAGGALVTCGGASALVLATAACIAGDDASKAALLPATEGMKNEFVILKGSRNPYVRSVTIAGGRIQEVGGDDGTTTPAQLEQAFGPKTAGLLFRRGKGTLPIEEVTSIAKRHDVPVIVDAAGETYPIEVMTQYLRSGVDLVAQGAKYFDGPGAAGILYGRRDLVEAAKRNSFTSFEQINYPEYYGKRGVLAIGRPMKLDRMAIVGTVFALQRWLSIDHRARFEEWQRAAERLAKRLSEVTAGTEGIRIGVTQASNEERHGIPTIVQIDLQGHSRQAGDVQRSLQRGDPSIWLLVSGNQLRISAETLLPGDEDVLVERLKLELAA